MMQQPRFEIIIQYHYEDDGPLSYPWHVRLFRYDQTPSGVEMTDIPLEKELQGPKRFENLSEAIKKADELKGIYRPN